MPAATVARTPQHRGHRLARRTMAHRSPSRPWRERAQYWGTSSRVALRISIIPVPNCKRRRWAPQSYATPGPRRRPSNPGLDPKRHEQDPSSPALPPRPPAYLHIGGARTALFNWLYARHTGGKMLLRIEDTDRERSTEPAIGAILEGLKWLGLEWDGEPLYQFARAARHREVAEQLLAAGKAYRCYVSPRAELDEMREASASGQRPLQALRRPLARPRSQGGARRRQAGPPAEGCRPRARP